MSPSSVQGKIDALQEALDASSLKSLHRASVDELTADSKKAAHVLVAVPSLFKYATDKVGQGQALCMLAARLMV